jgi:hypothetical protein
MTPLAPAKQSCSGAQHLRLCWTLTTLQGSRRWIGPRGRRKRSWAIRRCRALISVLLSTRLLYERYNALPLGDSFVVLHRRSTQVERWAMRLKIMTRRSSSPTKRRGELAYFGYWRGYGLSVRAATAAAAAAGCRSLEELRGLGWHFFEHRKNCGTRTLEELSQLVGGWPDAPRRHDALIRCASDDALISELRRRGIPVGRNETIWQC